MTWREGDVDAWKEGVDTVPDPDDWKGERSEDPTKWSFPRQYVHKPEIAARVDDLNAFHFDFERGDGFNYDI